MEEEYPRPTSRRCTNCGSYNVAERRSQEGIMIRLGVYCHACRTLLIFWTGSTVEEKRFKKRRNALRRRLNL